MLLFAIYQVEIRPVWRWVPVTCCLVLSGCISAAQPGGLRPAMQSKAASDQNITLRRVIEQDVWDKPLLPQPGNIWADVLPPGDSRPNGATAPGEDRSYSEPKPAMARARQSAPVMAAISDAGPTKDGPTKDGQTKGGPAAPGAKAVASSPNGPDAGDHPMVQLAALSDAQQAVAAWRRLRREAPKLTDGHNPEIVSADVNGRHVWRLRAGGFDDIAAATAFCTGIRTANADCWVVPASAIR